MFEDLVKNKKQEYFIKLEIETKKIKEKHLAKKFDRNEAIKRIIKYAKSLDW